MSLRCRLKKLVHKGELEEKDLDRIVIIPKEQEPSVYCISKKDLISAYICEGIDCGRCQFNLDENGCLLVNRIENLPSVQPKSKTGHWIPVSERMPEDGEECIITIRERWGEDEEWDYEITTAYYHNDKWIPSYDVWEGQELEITAWMLLPTEPYKPTDSEKEDKE